MKINSKQFYYIMIAVLILSFSGIVGALYWGNQQLKSKAQSIADLRSDSDISDAKIIALNKLQQSVELSDRTSKLLDSLLPKEKEQSKLVADIIYTATTESGIPIGKLGALSFTGNKEPSSLSGTEASKEFGGVYSYPFSLSVQNISYDTLLKFLQELENNDRLVQVDNIQISPDKQAPGQISSVNLSMKTFIKP